ncbi:MAG: OmpH family outer membrane protein [Halanaerobiales bacterium]|nr:OmpH family outer membrane protein [Halanaerobiales bacterium]
MKRSSKKIFLAMSILVVLAMAIAGCTSSPGEKIGVIDISRVIKESPKAQEYQNLFEERGAEIQEKYNLTEDEVKNLSEEEKAEKQKAALQEFLDAKQELEDKLNDEISKAVEEVTKEKKLDIVFHNQSVKVGGIDITQEVINKLQ